MPESISNHVKLAERGELKLLAFCWACGHGTRLSKHYAVSVIEGYTTLEELAAKMGCTICDATECSIDWAVRNPRGTEKLGVSDEQLRRAVSEVGPSAREVAKFLNRSLYVEE